MTVLLTLFSIVFVFPISCFTVGFKPACKRVGIFVLVGFVVDVLLGTLAFMFTSGYVF